MEDLPTEPEYVSPPGAMVEVPCPNPFPTGSRIETSTENYAAGGPPTITISSAVLKARAAIEARERQQGEAVSIALPDGLSENEILQSFSLPPPPAQP